MKFEPVPGQPQGVDDEMNAVLGVHPAQGGEAQQPGHALEAAVAGGRKAFGVDAVGHLDHPVARHEAHRHRGHLLAGGHDPPGALHREPAIHPANRAGVDAAVEHPKPVQGDDDALAGEPAGDHRHERQKRGVVIVDDVEARKLPHEAHQPDEEIRQRPPPDRVGKPVHRADVAVLHRGVVRRPGDDLDLPALGDQVLRQIMQMKFGAADQRQIGLQNLEHPTLGNSGHENRRGWGHDGRTLVHRPVKIHGGEGPSQGSFRGSLYRRALMVTHH